MAVTKTDNRSNGGRFEQELADRLAAAGFWVHVLQQNKSGQPADIIAVKGKFHTLIDCKVISDDDGFPFRRIEPNQRYAMRMFTRKAQELCYFALKLPDGEVHMVAMQRLEVLEGRKRTRLTDSEIRNHTWSLEHWIESSNTWGRRIHDDKNSKPDLYLRTDKGDSGVGEGASDIPEPGF